MLFLLVVRDFRNSIKTGIFFFLFLRTLFSFASEQDKKPCPFEALGFVEIGASIRAEAKRPKLPRLGAGVVTSSSTQRIGRNDRNSPLPLPNIRGLTHINGISISELEAAMQPLTDSAGQFRRSLAIPTIGGKPLSVHDLSMEGFLGPNERLIGVLERDQYVVEHQFHTTHSKLAGPLQEIIAQVERENFAPVIAGFRFEVKAYETHGPSQPCPFRCDGIRDNCEYIVTNAQNGQQVRFAGLLPHLIREHGFYEGFDTRYRVAPEDILSVFPFLNR